MRKKAKVNQIKKQGRKQLFIILALFIIVLGVAVYYYYGDQIFGKNENVPNIEDKLLLADLIKTVGATDNDCHTDSLSDFFSALGRSERIDDLKDSEMGLIIRGYISENDIKTYTNSVDSKKCLDEREPYYAEIECAKVLKTDLNNLYNKYDFKYKSLDEFYSSDYMKKNDIHSDKKNYYFSGSGGKICGSSSSHKISSWYGFYESPSSASDELVDRTFITLKDEITIKSFEYDVINDKKPLNNKSAVDVVYYYFSREGSSNYRLFLIEND